MNFEMTSYILITPVKNEDQSLTAVIDSVINQSILPRLWLIVDDGSTDKTPQIIESFEQKYDWIKSIRLPEHPRDIHFHYAYVCKVGFDAAINFCEENKILFDFVCLVDGDTILENSYFEKIFQEFKRDPLLGIASGGIYYNHNGVLKWERTINYPHGTGRVWSKKCFIDTAGYSIEPSPDTISNIKALLKGYSTKNFRDILAIQTRKTNSVGGFWRSYMKSGEADYYLCRRKCFILFNTIYHTLRYPFYCGLAYLLGYIKSSINRKPRIQDPEIRNYFQKQSAVRVLEYLKTFF